MINEYERSLIKNCKIVSFEYKRSLRRFKRLVLTGQLFFVHLKKSALITLLPFPVYSQLQTFTLPT